MFEYKYAVCKDCGKIVKHKMVIKKVNKKSGEVTIFEYFILKCPDCKGDIEKLEVIASWGICNTASLNVFKIEPYLYTDRLLVGINDQKPKWCSMLHEMDSDDTYIIFSETKYLLSECIRSV